MNQEPSQPVTELLVKWKHGDSKALDALLPLVYKELKAIAHHCLRQERPGHTLQPTALIHEAYVRLIGDSDKQWVNRAHFFGVAARLMRQILVDYARRHRTRKRGGELEKLPLDAAVLDANLNGESVLPESDPLTMLAGVARKD